MTFTFSRRSVCMGDDADAGGVWHIDCARDPGTPLLGPGLAWVYGDRE